ncbi:MAG: VWA domain-containing protein [Anaerolineae bacterium]|nr:VWA domain-containing protein [Anaerolineae bacterium]
MKRLVLLVLGILMVIPAAFVVMQDNAPPIHLQMTGINRTAYPTVVVNANVTDKVGQPVLGLGQDDFAVIGPLVNNMKIVKVENVTDDSLSFSVVLAIDTSSSMDGAPIERTKEAAISFINSIGPTDPVAIVTFDNKARLVQDFTTDKKVLTDTITNLRYGGQTALYDGSALAVATAANSPVPRRAVVILSDGQEYRASANARSVALDNALQVGVPVYTIGEGFGFDRSFMTSLANGTVAQFYESPDPAKLKEIYDGLAKTLRSQYIITLTTDLPGDGKLYQLALEVKDKNGSTANATIPMRARIYKPIVALPDIPKDPISEKTTVTAQVQSDDGITSATFQLNKDEAVAAKAPYTFTIDPAALKSGPNTLTFSATDSNGDTTTVTQAFTVAPKPPTVTITGVGDTVDKVTTATITGAATEGKVQGLIIKVNDVVVVSSLNKDTTTVKLDPSTLPPGENTLTATVTDTAGGHTDSSIKFTVPALPPTVTINGLTAGESITENRTVTVDAASPQTAVNKVVYKVDGKTIATQTAEPFTLDLDVKTIGVGNHILSVEATNDGGKTGKADVAFVIARPPTPTPTATSTSTNTPVPTDTKVPPTDTKVPPTATDTAAAPTATNTSLPATVTKTSAPPSATANASETAAVQADLSTNQAATSSAQEPTDTKVSPTDTRVAATSTTAPTDTKVAATNTKVPPTSTTAPTDTKVPPTNTTVPTKTVTATTEATVEVTEASTAEVTEAATVENTAEVTEAVTAEQTAEQTEVALGATSTTVATTTKEATAVSTNESQNVPTFTPIPLTAENQGAVGQAQSPLLIGATCLLGLLLLAIVYWFAARRRTR